VYRYDNRRSYQCKKKGLNRMPDAGKEIIRAAKSGDIEKVRALLNTDANLIHARDSDDSTPLHCATWKGHHTVVEYLLASGADVNAQNSNDHGGTTPLHAAAHANQAEIARMLIEHGANVNATDMQGKSPLHHTTFHKAIAAAKVLQNNGAV
jgi:ankyrin repeat protein